MPKPYGTDVMYDGQRYVVTPDGDVYVEIDQANQEWRLLAKNGSRAVAVRYQAGSGHTS